MPRARIAMKAKPMSPNTAPGRAHREVVRVQEHHAQGARPHRRHVDDREADPPEGGLEQQAQLVEGEHVHEDVDEVGVQEAARHQPVVLAGRHADLLPVERSPGRGGRSRGPPSGRVWSPEPMQAT